MISKPPTIPAPTKRAYSLDAPDQARLKIARAEIEAVLKRHDLGGAVVLHTPGMAEFFYDVQPSYSCAWIDQAAGIVRMKSKAADYAGDVDAQLRDQAATAQLFNALGMDCSKAGLMFLDVSDVVDKAFNVEAHTAGGLVPDPMEGKPQ